MSNHSALQTLSDKTDCEELSRESKSCRWNKLHSLPELWDHECNECKKRRNKPACQIMAPLLKTRLHFTFRPFAQTAMDFARPLYTIQGRRKPSQKRWQCLFTCLETRAAHLAMAWGLDTDTFLNAFTRFTSCRGVPKEVISDRGRNFVGAVGELKKPVGQLDRQKIESTTAELGVTK